MNTPPGSLDATVEQLARRVADLERRMGVGAREDAATPPLTAHTDTAGGVSLAAPDVGAFVTLTGRTLFVLAGAFLLRALTDSGRLDAGIGVLLGLAFAATWIVMTYRVGGRGQNASAAFHGLAFVLIAFPLVFEATTHFHFLNVASATIVLTACTAVALGVGWRRQLQGLAWVATLGGLVTATALVFGTAQLGPPALFLIVLGVAALWLGYALEWTLIRWPVALLADLAVFVLSVRAVAPSSADTPAIALGAQIGLLVGYLGSFATRTLLLNRDVVPFEVAQSLGALLAGLGGAAYLSRASEAGGLLVGTTTLFLAAGSYAAAAIFVERRQSRRKNYYFYTSAGLVLALAGSAIAARGVGVWLYAALGVLTATAGRLSKHMTYRVHAAVYLFAAVLAAGLLPFILYGLGMPFAPRRTPTWTMLAMIGGCAVSLWGLRPDTTPGVPTAWVHAPRLIVVVVLVGAALGLGVTWILPPGSGSHGTAGQVATGRTALLVATVLTLSGLSRSGGFVEGRWLTYPLLVLTGLKFLIEDVSVGRAATLVISFGLYGLALIAAPRLGRTTPAVRAPEEPRGG